MNNEHLKLFVRVARTQNISLAGNELGLSPPVASMHISKLEESLGVKLIHRTTRKVSLTEEGKAFLPHAEQVLESVNIARASVSTDITSPQGTIRITAPSSFGRMHIVPALKAFTKQYPQLKIELRQSDNIIDIIDGGFDIAIRNASLNDSSLVARKLAPDRRIICASPAYLKEYGTPKNPQDLMDHQCINLIGIDHWEFQTEQGIERIKPNSIIRIDNGESIRDLCVEGVGLTICSIWCCYKQLQAGQLVQVLCDTDLANDTAIWGVYPSSKLVAPKVRVFIDFFVNHFGDTPYWENV